MGTFTSSQDQSSTTITNNTSQVAITPNPQDPNQPEYQDIIQLILTNSSATGTEVIISDGTNNYVLYCPANDFRTLDLSNPLPGSNVNTSWTAQCLQSISSLYVNARWQARTQ